MNDRPETATGMLDNHERLSWLRLIRADNVGSSTFNELINRFGSAHNAIEMLPSLANRGGKRGAIRIPSIDDVERELEHADRFGARFVASCEPDYPKMLALLDQPPPMIAYKGDIDVFSRPTVAIVGSRNASLSGTKIAGRIARDLGRMGYVIVSGLARGIDASAHSGSLDSGTVAVLAGSLDRPYPDQNIPLFHQIIETGGAVVSERPFGWQARARDFPRRNRIIAGLAIGLVVIEAAERSGSLISARLAGECGRLVFAIPGSPLDPRAAGANKLLKDGATLVTDATDIAELLAPLAGPRLEPDPAPGIPSEAPTALPPGNAERDRIVELLGPTPIAVDDIIHHSGLEPAKVSTVLLELDLAGRLERHAGGAVSLIL